MSFNTPLLNCKNLTEHKKTYKTPSCLTSTANLNWHLELCISGISVFSVCGEKFFDSNNCVKVSLLVEFKVN